MFALLCQYWDGCRKAGDELKKTGRSYTTPRGKTEQHPLVRVEQIYANMFVTLGDKFGLNPASRKRYGWVIKDGDKRDPFEEFLMRRSASELDR